MIIRRGAEAEIHLTKWRGQKVIAKRRVPKTYRLAVLDEDLRQVRIKTEAKLLASARKVGVPTPAVLDINSSDCELVMEYIDGPRLKDVLPEADPTERQELLRTVGKHVGTLHSQDIIHGDLTTSNMIVEGGLIYFIDFSLGEWSIEFESKGVDLHVLMEAYESTHPELLEEFKFVMEGYREKFKDAKAVEDKIQDIISRGRYT
ncbi:MAG: Kae1-associated serine/threonine protein kinase [Thermoplasmata archaeon]|nr:MAG: Kae1-associated serine/threonine protein kinase [Thermoplasmata archaeon]